MNSSELAVPTSVSRERADAAVQSLPWYVWCGLAAVTSEMVGGQWDIAWHRSIGRDSFWTPPHILIYLTGVLAGIACGYLVFVSTFGSDLKQRQSSVTVFGLRGPLGAFICGWGGV